ncbi:hypothetical protein PCANB_003007 [Pneumocystis canis]|nr:hypothetical protein PCK1_003102 [Pneumocystis canis]KAG5438156.1 hypothetical protein PCANB_003007 [Pneumocystis canis]
MRKKENLHALEGDSKLSNTGDSLKPALLTIQFNQRSKELPSETISSFTLKDMILSINHSNNEDNGKMFQNDSENLHHYKNFSEKNVEKTKNTNDKISSIFDHKNHKDNHLSISDELSLSNPPVCFIDTSCGVSQEVTFYNDFPFNKKNQKTHLLSSSIASFHSSMDGNSITSTSKEKENTYLSKILKENFHDNELFSDSDLCDNDEGIFHFDKDHSSSPLKKSSETNGENTLDWDESEIENEKIHTIIIEEKSPQMFNTFSKKTEVSPYNHEDLFWTEDLQDENPYIPLFKRQTYKEYSSSDDIWSYCSSSFVSETNDVTDLSNGFFFGNDSDMSGEKGNTTDEDQSFIIKKINQKKDTDLKIINDNTEKENSCFVENSNHIVVSHDTVASKLTEKENSSSNSIPITSSTNSGTTISNTLNKPPLLGTWARDLKRPMGIIDGTGTNVINPIMSSCTIFSPTSTSLSPSSIPSLDDILDTSAFVQLSSSDSSSSSITKNYLSDFCRWDKIPIGTFRRHQQRFTDTREELVKGEWYVLTNKSRRQKSNVPILGTTITRKKKKLRKQKYRNNLKNSIELFEEDENEIGKEQCGLGLGPQLSPLFDGLS